MPLDGQTPDEVCQALGLPGFVTEWMPGMPRQELRVLLLPTFHPEICMEFCENEGTTMVTVTCAKSKISPFEPPSPALVDQDSGALVDTSIAELEASLRNALIEPDALTQGRDGMDINIFWRTLRAGLIVQFANSSQHPVLGAFVAQLIPQAYLAIKCSACKDSLAEAGVYVELDLGRSRAGQ
ncbi:MAG: hypothetical protein ACR2OV_11470 [Hyphomicrobiaceae bacterium]